MIYAFIKLCTIRWFEEARRSEYNRHPIRSRATTILNTISRVISHMYNFIAYSSFFYRANTGYENMRYKKSTVIIVAKVYRDTRVTGAKQLSWNFELFARAFKF